MQKASYNSSESHRFASDEEEARDNDVEAQNVCQHIKFLLESHFGQLSGAPYNFHTSGVREGKFPGLGPGTGPPLQTGVAAAFARAGSPSRLPQGLRVFSRESYFGLHNQKHLHRLLRNPKSLQPSLHHIGLNLHWTRATLGRRRGGASNESS